MPCGRARNATIGEYMYFGPSGWEPLLIPSIATWSTQNTWPAFISVGRSMLGGKPGTERKCSVVIGNLAGTASSLLIRVGSGPATKYSAKVSSDWKVSATAGNGALAKTARKSSRLVARAFLAGAPIFGTK